MGPTTLWRAARDLLAEDVREELRFIVAPTLLVWEDNDPLIPPALGEVLREEISDSRLLIMRKTGHAPMSERPGSSTPHSSRSSAGSGSGSEDR